MNAAAPRRFPRAWRVALAALMVVSLAATFNSAGAQNFTAPTTPPPPLPPLIPALPAPNTPARSGLHLPDFPVHDPWILADQANHTYYLYTAAGTGRTGYGRTGTFFYKSKDLADWDGPYLCFLEPDSSWADPRRGAWAPEVHFYQGKYYLFTTLHNPEKLIAPGDTEGNPKMMRSTMIAVSDSPEGPFRLTKLDAPIAPPDFMTLDGTFYVDPAGHPWMVYAHEWVQKIDGTMEAIPLNADLSGASGPPIYLFKGSDAPWINAQAVPSTKPNHYVTDGPEMWRTQDGHLIMLWSSYDNDGYVETLARSKSGDLAGPWEQLPLLVGNDSGHGMLFHSFDGHLLMILHHPFQPPAHGRIFEMDDSGDTVRVVKERTDLDDATSPNDAGVTK
jgi:Glycosyl hydrolases family 43